MISEHKHKKLTWIDLESPTREEVIKISEKYDLSPLVSDEILRKTMRSKVDLYSDTIYLILHFPITNRRRDTESMAEIDFIIGKNFLITAHYELIDPIHKFSKDFEVNSILKKTEIGKHAGFMFFHLIKELYRHAEGQLEDIDLLLKKIERNIFEGKESEMVKDISYVNRKLLDFKQATRFHKEVLNSFDIAAKKFFGDDFSYYLSTIQGEYNKVQNLLDSHKEVLLDLRDTNDSLLTDKTRYIMRKLTVLSFTMLPLTVIISIFLITPESFLIQTKTAMYFALFIVLVVPVVIYFFFKNSKWI